MTFFVPAELERLLQDKLLAMPSQLGNLALCMREYDPPDSDSSSPLAPMPASVEPRLLLLSALLEDISTRAGELATRTDAYDLKVVWNAVASFDGAMVSLWDWRAREQKLRRRNKRGADLLELGGLQDILASIEDKVSVPIPVIFSIAKYIMAYVSEMLAVLPSSKGLPGDAGCAREAEWRAPQHRRGDAHRRRGVIATATGKF